MKVVLKLIAWVIFVLLVYTCSSPDRKVSDLLPAGMFSEKYIKCTNCAGRGQIECSRCFGRGTFTDLGYTSTNPWRSENNRPSRTYNCFTCKGSGLVFCKVCDGTGNSANKK